MSNDDITIRPDEPAIMRDGTVLRADLYITDRPGPVVLIRTPYGKSAVVPSNILALVRAGLHVAVQDVRGRGTSEGEWYPFRFEAQDGVDSIEWASQMSGSDGRVALMGRSYAGMAALLAAMEQPPALVGVSASISGTDPRNGLISRGGAFELGLQGFWQALLAPDRVARRAARSDPFDIEALTRLFQLIDNVHAEYSARPLADFAGYSRSGISEYFGDALEQVNQSDARVVEEARVDPARITVPVLCIGGWFDIYTDDTIRLYTALRAQGKLTRLLMGPWTHTQVPPLSPVMGDVVLPLNALFIDDARSRTMLDLEQQWLASCFEQADHDPAAVHEQLEGARWYTMGSDRWESAPAWPPSTATREWCLTPDGRLSEENAPTGASHYVFDPADPAPTHGGNTLLPPGYIPGPVEQSEIEQRTDVLCFDSEVLTHPLSFAGPVDVKLWVSTTAVSTDFVARLCDVDENGRSISLTDGIQRVTSKQDGKPHLVTVKVWPFSATLASGHRLRLQITSSSFPRWDVNLGMGEAISTAIRSQTAIQTIFHGGQHASSISLPVREAHS